MNQNRIRIQRTRGLTLLLIATTVGLSSLSDDGGNATASPPVVGGLGGYDCVTFDAGGARLANHSFLMFGEPLVGRTDNDGTIAVFGGIFCLQAAQTAVCPSDGDLNADGSVILADFGIFQACFGNSPIDQCQCADLNGDNMIDLLDYSLLRSNW